MEDFIDSLKKAIPQIFESEEYQKQRRELVDKHREREKAMVKEFEAKAKKEGFTVVQVQVGPFTRPDIVPVVAANPVPLDQLENLVDQGQFPKETFEQLKAKYGQFSGEMEQVLKATRKAEKIIQDELNALDKSAISHLVGEAVGDLKEKYALPKIQAEEAFCHALNLTEFLRRQAFRCGSRDSRGVRLCWRQILKLPARAGQTSGHCSTTWALVQSDASVARSRINPTRPSPSIAPPAIPLTP